MKIFHLSFRRALVLALMAAAAALSTLGVETALGQHQHESAGGVHPLQLDNGKKWATDAPLRQGMTAVREAVAAEHQAIHANKASPEQYKALAAKIDEQIAYIVANCKLNPKADAQLHVILTDIIGGSDLMKAGDQAEGRKGAIMVIGALQKYPKYFDHPGWRAI
ncbi:MAG TPA: hypothetical protein VFB54_14040 [Burkholderiales bacterium]|nr:hypothetical protein [Burkholderiales bacterium]